MLKQRPTKFPDGYAICRHDLQPPRHRLRIMSEAFGVSTYMLKEAAARRDFVIVRVGTRLYVSDEEMQKFATKRGVAMPLLSCVSRPIKHTAVPPVSAWAESISPEDPRREGVPKAYRCKHFDDPQKSLHTGEAVADSLRVSRNKILEAARDLELGCVLMGRRAFFREEHVRAYMYNEGYVLPEDRLRVTACKEPHYLRERGWSTGRILRSPNQDPALFLKCHLCHKDIEFQQPVYIARLMTPEAARSKGQGIIASHLACVKASAGVACGGH